MASGDNRFDLSLHGIAFAAVSIGLLLEALADTLPAPAPKFSSKCKLAFLQRLISKHGYDVAAMMRDRRLNPDQRTEGEIRRAIKMAGGFEKLGAQVSQVDGMMRTPIPGNSDSRLAACKDRLFSSDVDVRRS
jgi:hypothetical protein